MQSGSKNSKTIPATPDNEKSLRISEGLWVILTLLPTVVVDGDRDILLVLRRSVRDVHQRSLLALRREPNDDLLLVRPDVPRLLVKLVHHHRAGLQVHAHLYDATRHNTRLFIAQ